jgi:hypothetical protein
MSVSMLPGGDGVDADVALGVLERDGARNANHGVLAGGVGARAGSAEQPERGRVVDDGAAAGGEHRAHLVLHAQPHAPGVDHHDAVVLVVRVGVDAAAGAFGAGVVEGRSSRP